MSNFFNSFQINPDPAQAVSSRITSIDALRGFTMIWIIGGEVAISSLYKIWPNSFTQALAINMDHAGWSGFHFWDLIAPLFLFLVGLLIPYTITTRQEKGVSTRELYSHIGKRAFVIYFLGLAQGGLFNFDWPQMRWSMTLAQIAICYFCASILVVHLKWRVQTIVILVILLGYWAILEFVPVPGYGAGVHTPEGSITSWLDQRLIPGKLGLGLYDRQGVLSTFPAIASTLIGVLAGHWLRSGRTGNQKTLGFLLAGITTLAAGWIWGHFFFISRNIWTSSFVLYTSGYCFLIMALFYWVIDIKGYKKWTFPLVVIGMNAITIWIGQDFINFKFTSDALLSGVSKYCGVYQTFLLASGVLLMKWLFLWFLYRKKIFLKA
jgi:predicted acyltransferase